MWENFLSLRGQGAFNFSGLKAEEGFFWCDVADLLFLFWAVWVRSEV